jgi:hydrogenase expression/formation protein HypC
VCLAIPGKIVELIESQPPFTSAFVEFGGIRRQVNTACVPEALLGDYVMVHAGIAISRVDAAEAAKVLETLEQLALTEEDEPVDYGQDPIHPPKRNPQ